MSDFICLSCPNGCHLQADLQPDGTVRVQGNKCDKGLAFAHAVIKKNTGAAAKVVAAQVKPVYDDIALTQICTFWGVAFKKTRPTLMPAGSPERTLFRVVIEDDQQKFFVLERIRPAAFHAKMKIIKTLEFLSRRGLSRIAPYWMGKEEQYIQEYKDGLWQLVPFLPGEELDRQTYLYDGWRAKVLSSFLIDLRAKSDGIALYSLDERFSIKKYVYTLSAQIKARHPELMSEVGRVISFLEAGFMPAHDSLPVAFCHGDYHPMNVIWGTDDIKAVIDWEFAGMKPEMYDLANMVGCLGIEHPSSLTGDLVIGLTRQLKGARLFEEVSWDFFLEFVIALRFAWLSEWLRKHDHEMVTMELDYMALLVDNKDELKRLWGINNGSLTKEAV
ncbi:MAG: phosphotransferase [Candidatus Omnitrophica bacterium]|nr:phosphotransferase [Candidatus Omnitrophota bacterium]